jgi:uncharacterized membrane protein
MKRILQFLRTTLVGGLLFLVPIIVLVVILGKALAIAHKLVDPLAERLPVHSAIGLRTPMLLAVAIIVLFCFLAGGLARTALAKKLVRSLETAVLADVPGSVYSMTQDRIKAVDIPASGAMKCLRRVGAGSNALLHGLHLPLPTDH